jgi:hypothetical protein
VTVPIAELPDGTFIVHGDNDFRLIWRGALLRWSPERYTDPVTIAEAGFNSAVVITPSLSVAALRAGYPVEVHHSVSDRAIA